MWIASIVLEALLIVLVFARKYVIFVCISLLGYFSRFASSTCKMFPPIASSSRSSITSPSPKKSKGGRPTNESRISSELFNTVNFVFKCFIFYITSSNIQVCINFKLSYFLLIFLRVSFNFNLLNFIVIDSFFLPIRISRLNIPKYCQSLFIFSTSSVETTLKELLISIERQKLKRQIFQ